MNKDFVKKYEALQQDVRKINEHMSELASLASEELQEYGQEIGENIQEKAHQAAAMTRQKTKELDELAHENPWMMVAVVSTVSLLVGLLLSHGNRQRQV